VLEEEEEDGEESFEESEYGSEEEEVEEKALVKVEVQKKVPVPKIFSIHDTPPYSTIDMQILYGNIHIKNAPGLEKVVHGSSKNQTSFAHRWIMFVYLDNNKKELTDRVINDVTYNIKNIDIAGESKQSKEQRKVTVSQQPFLMSRPGNKQLTIKINITFKKWTKLLPCSFTHMLSLEGDGQSGNKNVKISVPSENYIQNMMEK
jgi:hypothetical protein